MITILWRSRCTLHFSRFLELASNPRPSYSTSEACGFLEHRVMGGLAAPPAHPQGCQHHPPPPRWIFTGVPVFSRLQIPPCSSGSLSVLQGPQNPQQPYASRRKPPGRRRPFGSASHTGFPANLGPSRLYRFFFFLNVTQLLKFLVRVLV